MKTLYIARHAETQWNVEDRLQGRMDSPLTPRGKAQCAKLGERLRDVSLDVVWTSNSRRTLDSIQLILAGRDAPVLTDVRLLAMNLGNWQGHAATRLYELGEADKVQSDYFWNHPASFQTDGKETFGALIGRTRNFVRMLAGRPEKSVLIIGHTFTTMALLTAWDGRTAASFWDFPFVESTGLTIIETDDNMHGEIVMLNNIDHLC